MLKDVIFFLDIVDTLPTLRGDNGLEQPDLHRAERFSRRAMHLATRGYTPRLVMVSSLRKLYDKARAEERYTADGITIPFHDDWRIDPETDNATGVRQWLAKHEREVAAHVIFDDRSQYHGSKNFILVPTYTEDAKFKGFKAKEVDAAFMRIEAQLAAAPKPWAPVAKEARAASSQPQP